MFLFSSYIMSCMTPLHYQQRALAGMECRSLRVSECIILYATHSRERERWPAMLEKMPFQFPHESVSDGGNDVLTQACMSFTLINIKPLQKLQNDGFQFLTFGF